MPTEAAAFSRFKEFKYRIEINGLPAALVREFNPGDRHHGVTEHAGAGQNFAYKEVGMIKYDNANLKMVLPLDGPGRSYFEEWLNQGQNPQTGNGSLPALYQRNFSMYELGPDGTPMIAWEFKAAFPVRLSLGNRNAMNDNADVIEEIEIAYARREQRIL